MLWLFRKIVYDKYVTSVKNAVDTKVYFDTKGCCANCTDLIIKPLLSYPLSQSSACGFATAGQYMRCPFFLR